MPSEDTKFLSRPLLKCNRRKNKLDETGQVTRCNFPSTTIEHPDISEADPVGHMGGLSRCLSNSVRCVISTILDEAVGGAPAVITPSND